MEKLYSSEELGERYGISKRAIEGWRYRGDGPLWIKPGREIKYRECDIEAWEAEQAEGGKPRRRAAA